MNSSSIFNKPNIIGSAASFLCLIHCIATPFLFVAQAELAHHTHNHPAWWGLLDILFLVVSFFAVLWSAKSTKIVGLSDYSGLAGLLLPLLLLTKN